MKPHLLRFMVVIFLFATINLAVAEDHPLAVGNELPEIILPVPKDISNKNYLGLTGDGTFRISEVKAGVVIIEIFSMYCPHCQREAPTLNEFYAKIQSDVNLKDKIKLIGIGAGNSKFEVSFFKKKYNIPFPLFADRDFVIHQKIGDVRTPYFIGVKIRADGSHHIFYSKLGGPKAAGPFLNSLLKESGLN